MNESDRLYLEEFKNKLSKKHNKDEYDFYTDPVCMGEYKIEVRKVLSNIPAKFRNLTLKNFVAPGAENAKGFITDYLDNLDKYRKKGIAPFLNGSNGTGKSGLGAIVLMEVIKRGFTAYWTRVDECKDLLTAGWYSDEIKQEFNNKILNVDFLMIDDLGDELRNLNSNLVESTINRILRTRTDNLKPTIITSNYKANEKLKSIYDNRIYSILKEHALIVECNGDDFRDILSDSINPR